MILYIVFSTLLPFLIISNIAFNNIYFNNITGNISNPPTQTANGFVFQYCTITSVE